MNNSGKPIFFKYSADDLFFFAFNLNIGLLPPLITLIGNKALQLPLIFTAVLIYFRLLVRPKVLARFTKTLGDANILLIMALIGLLVINAITADYWEDDRMRILLKPGLVLLAMTTLRYSVSNQCELDQNRLGNFLMTGMIISLLTIFFYSFFSASEWVQYLENQIGMVKVNKLNRALEVSSVLVFLCAVGVTDRLKSISVTIILAIGVYLLSFYVVGSAFWTGTWHPGIHVDSETVQFGMPIAFLVFLLAQRFPRFMTNLVFSGICLLLLAAPWIYQLVYKVLLALIDPTMPIGVQKILFRGEIWDLVARKSLESPIFGHGIDSARYLGNIVVNSTYKSVNVLSHPHNMILQLWLDLGFTGVIIVFGLLVLGWRFMTKIPTTNHAAILGGLVMLTVFSIVSHSLWQAWSVALIAIFITLVASLHSTSPKPLD